MITWYQACREAASLIRDTIPDSYRSRTFPGIIGDIKALTPKKALSLISRKKGLGKQYAYLYLTRGIDDGRGYQACAARALMTVLGRDKKEIIHGDILDVGCAVGVTAGVLSLRNITGFDLFTDLLKAAVLVDSFSGRQNRYVAADMTRNWPFTCAFDTVVCGLVCHHLKEQSEVVSFFTNMNRVLRHGGYAVITLPAGSIGTTNQLENIAAALESFGFQTDRRHTGLVHSTDNAPVLFWMFMIIARKTTDTETAEFISPDFGFHLYRTPETREEKGLKARSTASSRRMVKHERFALINIDEMHKRFGEKLLVYAELSAL